MPQSTHFSYPCLTVIHQAQISGARVSTLVVLAPLRLISVPDTVS